MEDWKKDAEIERLQAENLALKNRVNQRNKTIKRLKVKARDLQGRLTIMTQERDTLIACIEYAVAAEMEVGSR